MSCGDVTKALHRESSTWAITLSTRHEPLRDAIRDTNSDQNPAHSPGGWVNGDKLLFVSGTDARRITTHTFGAQMAHVFCTANRLRRTLVI